MEAAAVTGIAPAAFGAEVDKKTGMPTRLFGRTGKRISILAFGCGSRFLAYGDPDKAGEVLNRALDQGITYVDTAFGYGNGKSEEWVGRAIKGRRDNLWLTTKLSKRNGDEAMRQIEGGLKRLQTDHLDLIHAHALLGEDDLKQIEAPDGVLKVLYKLRDQKVTRAIGISCHANPEVLKAALEHNDFDCTQMALNAARMGEGGGGARRYSKDFSFETIALPVANRKKMGVIAMKVFAQEKLNGAAPVETLIRYAMSLPVSAAVVGMPKPEHVEENIRIAKAFKPMLRNEMEAISDKLAATHKASIDRYFANHIDC